MTIRLTNNRIDRKFAALAEKEEKALITYVMAGDPDLEVTAALIRTLARSGADLIELGAPFSDPLADGPAIQRAGQRALAAGANLAAILNLVRQVREDTDVPLVIMSYFNPVLQFGLQEFAAGAAEAGVDGVILPDLPLEESGRILQLLEDQAVHLVPLLAPTSTDDKINRVAQGNNGFVYCVSLTGVTGTRENLPAGVELFLQRVRRQIKQPVAVGFGISNPQQARKLTPYADGVIVGSAIVNLIEKYGREISRLEAEISQFVGTLKESLKPEDNGDGSSILANPEAI